MLFPAQLKIIAANDEMVSVGFWRRYPKPFAQPAQVLAVGDFLFVA